MLNHPDIKKGIAIIQVPVFLQTISRRCWPWVMLISLLTSALQQKKTAGSVRANRMRFQATED
jgi:hypothetical protein